jgi:uncharacterized membrane protein YidH (DUF202 family)
MKMGSLTKSILSIGMIALGLALACLGLWLYTQTGLHILPPASYYIWAFIALASLTLTLVGLYYFYETTEHFWRTVSFYSKQIALVFAGILIFFAYGLFLGYVLEAGIVGTVLALVGAVWAIRCTRGKA